MLYIHQYPDWTHFRFDSRKVLNALGETRLQEGKLIGAMETCGFQDLEQELLIQDICSNSAIDGIHLDKAFVEQQVALVQGGSAQSADPAVRIYLAAITKAFNPLTQERLFAWHASMGQNKVASFRAAPSAVQYRQGELQLDFEGPNPERLEQEVERYIQWMESSSMDGVIKAAVAHFWFATLRPFADANGRLARLLTIVALARSEQIVGLFERSESEITRRDATILRLREEVDSLRSKTLPSIQIAKELRARYPDIVSEVFLSRGNAASPDSLGVLEEKPRTVAIVRTNGGFPPSETARLEEWLRIRLEDPTLELLVLGK